MFRAVARRLQVADLSAVSFRVVRAQTDATASSVKDIDPMVATDFLKAPPRGIAIARHSTRKKSRSRTPPFFLQGVTEPQPP